MAVKQNYRASGLNQTWLAETRKYLKKLDKNLENLGCTKIEFGINYNYWSGFFTAPNGQIWYMCGGENTDACNYYYRTAAHYRDFTGGRNQFDNNIIGAIR